MQLFTTGRDGRTTGPLLPVPNVSCILYNVCSRSSSAALDHWIKTVPEERTPKEHSYESYVCIYKFILKLISA